MKLFSGWRHSRFSSIMGVIAAVLLIISLMSQSLVSAAPAQDKTNIPKVSFHNPAGLSTPLPPVAQALNQSVKKGKLPTLPLTVVTGSPPLKITGDSVLLSCDLVSLGEAEQVQVGFEYGEEAGYGYTTGFQEMITPGKVSIRVQDLKADAEYHYRAKAFSPTGEVDGEDAVFTIQLLEEVALSPTPEPLPAHKPKSSPKITPPAKAATAPASPSPAPAAAPSPSPSPNPLPEPAPEPPPAPTPNIISLTGKIDEQGKLTEDITVASVDNTVKVLLSTGTQGLRPDGKPLAEISLDQVTRSFPPFPTDTIIVSPLYELGPAEAALSPAVTLSFDYDPAGFFQGLEAAALYIAYFDRTSSRWIKLDSQVEAKRNSVSAVIDRFNIYALMTASVPADLPAPEYPPDRVKTRVDPNKAVELKSGNNRISLKIPEGAASVPLEVELEENYTFTTVGTTVVRSFELNAYNLNTREKFSQFARELSLSIQHEEGELDGLDTSSLRLYYLDEEQKTWVPVPDSRYDPETRILTATLTHFSQYGEIANPLINGPGRVMASQIDLHAGAATFSYPIELPPGPGGFQPQLELTYNSASVDEMKNRRDVGSWVGTGWNLNLGRISLDLGTKEYYLETGSGAYKLVTTNGTDFHTNPEQYYKIKRHVDPIPPYPTTWEMWDKEGTYYTFGGTPESRQHINSAIYRWDLNLFRDANGNTATISYIQDVRNTSPDVWVRSAYPEYLNYNNDLVSVHFVTGGAIPRGNDGLLRPDNPISYTNPYPPYNVINPAPKVMENRELVSIEIRVNNSLIRRYDFDYNTTETLFHSQHYGGIYYAGEHTLSSITQVGVDGAETKSLPPMSFEYSNRSIYRYDPYVPNYDGNPGNPTYDNLNWKHLWKINSGYSGAASTVEFQYTSIPEASMQTENTWTRQVVTGKTINSGSGESQTYTYEYTDGPHYLGSDWGQQYRGFGQVKEIDGDQNYAIHYFYTTLGIGSFMEKLTGKEYITRWYQKGNPGEPDILLREANYDWSPRMTEQHLDNQWVRDIGMGTPIAAAVGVNGDVYVVSIGGNLVQQYNAEGSLVKRTYGIGYLSLPNDVAVSSDGYVYVSDFGHNRIVRFYPDGWYHSQLGIPSPLGVAVSPDGTVYATSLVYDYVFTFDANNNLVPQFYVIDPSDVIIGPDGYIYITSTTQFGAGKCNSYGSFWASYNTNNTSGAVAVSADSYVYVADIVQNRVAKFTNNGIHRRDLMVTSARGVAAGNYYLYTISISNNYIRVFALDYDNWAVQLMEVEEITFNAASGNKTSCTRYVYDNYGNVKTEYRDGDADDPNDNSTFAP